MNKIKIINAIKGVFSALGAKTSDSNYAVALLDKTSAEPKGMMDFANLASVLGATYDLYISKNESATLASGVYIVGNAYLGFCVISCSTNGGIIEVGGKTLSSMNMSTSGQTITYGDGVGSSRTIKKLLSIQ